MSNRSRTAWLISLALAALLPAARAAGPDAPPRPKMVQRVYPVADLVIPINDYVTPARIRIDSRKPVTDQPLGPAVQAIIYPAPGTAGDVKPCRAAAANPTAVRDGDRGDEPPAPPTREDDLIRLITTTVAPESWADAGGRGTIDYMPIGMALVVHQSPQVQEQVADLLKSLRKLQDVQVALEVRVLTVSDCGLEQIGKALDMPMTRGQTLLTGPQVSQLMEAAQGDRRANVHQAPKLTTYSGQEANVGTTEDRFFVTGLKCQYAKGQMVYVPQNEPITIGFQMTVRPTVTADHKAVLLMLDAELRELADSPVPLFPVTYEIKPVFEGGAQGQPIPFTQLIQQPTVITRGVTKVMGVPDGQTAVLYAGRATRTVQEETPAPIIGEIPFLGELFTTTTTRTESDHLLFLVTPRVMMASEACEEKAAAVKAARSCHESDAEEQCPRAAAAADAPYCPGCPKACDAPPRACPPPPVPAAMAASSPHPITPPVTIMPGTEVAPPPRQVTLPVTAAPCCPVAAAPCPAAAPVPPAYQGIQVQLDACILSMDPAYYDRPDAAAWADLSPKACKGQPKLISAEVAERFCNAVRAQKGGKCLAQPRLVTLNGRPATFLSGGEQTFVQGVEFVDGKAEPVFKMATVPLGTQVTFLPVASADGRYVQLQMTALVSKLEPIPSAGYQVTITPTEDSAGQADRTEVIRRPAMNVQQLEPTVFLPVGRAVLFHVEAGGSDQQPLIVMVTPNVINPCPAACPPVAAYPPPVACPPPPVCPPVAALPYPAVMCQPEPYAEPAGEEQTAPFARPTPAADPKLAKLLTKYRQACAAGDAAKARKLADRCLAIDPICFGN
jgi:type II secretory pathway component GspD/PulD (secretin)